MNRLLTLKTKQELCFKKKIHKIKSSNLNWKPSNLKNLHKNHSLKIRYKKWNNKLNNLWSKKSMSIKINYNS